MSRICSRCVTTEFHHCGLTYLDELLSIGRKYIQYSLRSIVRVLCDLLQLGDRVMDNLGGVFLSPLSQSGTDILSPLGECVTFMRSVDTLGHVDNIFRALVTNPV